MQATGAVSTDASRRRVVTIAQLTLATSQTGASARCAFGTQGRSVGHTNSALGVNDWEENCIEVFVGGNQNGYGTHATDVSHRTALPPPAPAPPPPPPPGPPLCSTDPSVLGPLAYGRWTFQGSTQATQVATAICNQGYTPAGGSGPVRVCTFERQGTTRWSPGGVYCEPNNLVTQHMECPLVPDDPYGVWTVRPIGSSETAVLICNNGDAPVSPVGNAGEYGTSTCDNRGSDIAPPHWSPPFDVGGQRRMECPRPLSPPSPPPPPPPPPPSSSPIGYVVVLILLGGAVYVAKDKSLGPFAPKGEASLVSGPDKIGGGESTIYDTGGDETL